MLSSAVCDSIFLKDNNGERLYERVEINIERSFYNSCQGEKPQTKATLMLKDSLNLHHYGIGILSSINTNFMILDDIEK